MSNRENPSPAPRTSPLTIVEDIGRCHSSVLTRRTKTQKSHLQLSVVPYSGCQVDWGGIQNDRILVGTPLDTVSPVPSSRTRGTPQDCPAATGAPTPPSSGIVSTEVDPRESLFEDVDPYPTLNPGTRGNEDGIGGSWYDPPGPTRT